MNGGFSTWVASGSREFNYEPENLICRRNICWAMSEQDGKYFVDDEILVTSVSDLQ